MWYKNVRAQNILILSFFFGGLISMYYVVSTEPELSQSEMHEVERVVFNELFEYVELSLHNSADFYFIGVSNQDPSRQLLTDLSNHEPKTERISLSEITFGYTSAVIHKNDRDKEGIIFDLKEIKKLRDGSIRVNASVYKSRSSSGAFEYMVAFRNGDYSVLSAKASEEI